MIKGIAIQGNVDGSGVSISLRYVVNANQGNLILLMSRKTFD